MGWLKRIHPDPQEMEIGMLNDRRGSNMAEAAVTLPVVLLLLMLIVNMSLAGYSALAAANAASYGARAGAVARENSKGWAYAAAQTALGQSGAPGNFDFIDVRAEDEPGSAVRVTVYWSYPTIFAGLCAYFGDACPREFSGSATAVWKKEGW